MDDAFLIVGLGNPGSEYVRTRHNAGFMVVELLGDRWGAAWKADSALEARLARVARGSRRLILCEPLTYMNESGRAVVRVAGYFRVPVERMVVVADDADLPLGTIRMRARGGSGGHHGLESIAACVGSSDYARLKVGIGRANQTRAITNHVLGRFDPAETAVLEKVLARAADQIESVLDHGIAKAMNDFNRAADAPNLTSTE